MPISRLIGHAYKLTHMPRFLSLRATRWPFSAIFKVRQYFLGDRILNSDVDFASLTAFLAKVPSIKGRIGVGQGTGDMAWWAKFTIDPSDPLAWRVVQELAHVLNYLSLDDRLPTVFMPVSPLSILCWVAVATLLLAVLAWRFDPPLRSNLIDGSVVGWQRSDNPSPPSAHLHRTWLLVKIDDGRTVGVASDRESQPSAGERVIVQERIGLLGTRKFYEMPN
jgi:hypothetical protein